MPPLTPSLSTSSICIFLVLLSKAFNFSAEASNTAGSKSFSTGKDFVELELIGKTQYNHNTSVFRLALPESETLEMPVASFILLGYVWCGEVWLYVLLWLL